MNCIFNYNFSPYFVILQTFSKLSCSNPGIIIARPRVLKVVKHIRKSQEDDSWLKSTDDWNQISDMSRHKYGKCCFRVTFKYNSENFQIIDFLETFWLPLQEEQ